LLQAFAVSFGGFPIKIFYQSGLVKKNNGFSQPTGFADYFSGIAPTSFFSANWRICALRCGFLKVGGKKLRSGLLMIFVFYRRLTYRYICHSRESGTLYLFGCHGFLLPDRSRGQVSQE
jgi:hypothetical protein